MIEIKHSKEGLALEMRLEKLPKSRVKWQKDGKLKRRDEKIKRTILGGLDNRSFKKRKERKWKAEN